MEYTVIFTACVYFGMIISGQLAYLSPQAFIISLWRDILNALFLAILKYTVHY